MHNFVENATDDVDFLDQVDIAYPSIERKQWQNDVHVGLENFSLELIRPVSSLVDRIGNNRWKHHHLYQFFWQELKKSLLRCLHQVGTRLV